MTIDRRTPRTGVSRAALLVLASIGSVLTMHSPAGAATTTTIKVPGATITRVDASTASTITVKATVARLDLWCTSNRIVANKQKTTIPCNRLGTVTTTGLTGNDTVVVNATGIGSPLGLPVLNIKTGAGNDVISVKHRGRLTVFAGSGNDRIESGFGAGTTDATQKLLGEDGNDTITDLGELVGVSSGPHDVPLNPDDRTTIIGGPDADRFPGGHGSSYEIWADLSDTIEPTASASYLHLTAAAADDYVQLHGNWLNGTSISIVSTLPGGVTRQQFTFPIAQVIGELTVDTGEGNDTITLDGVPPDMDMVFVGGPGTDSAAYRLVDPCTWNPTTHVVDCDGRTFRNDATVEKATFTPA